MEIDADRKGPEGIDENSINKAQIFNITSSDLKNWIKFSEVGNNAKAIHLMRGERGKLKNKRIQLGELHYPLVN